MKIEIFFRNLPMVCGLALAIAGLNIPAPVEALPLQFSSSLSYNNTPPITSPNAISNWKGSTFDADNVGGSGINSGGGADNGIANDATTYVAGDRPAQGQTFQTGQAVNGYDLSSITVRVAGYTTNNVTAPTDFTAWNLSASNGPIRVHIVGLDGATTSIQSIQNVMAGEKGNPAANRSANGAGTYLTFNLAFPVHLEPNKTYGFDLSIGNASKNFFELAGIKGDSYAGGSAYTRNGNTINPLDGDRVFMLNLSPTTKKFAFVHPGGLHTQADFDRMKAKIAAGAQPWKGSWDKLLTSPEAQLGWPAAPVETIIRGVAGNNYTRSQRDAAAVYQMALRYQITGDTAYADKAVSILNAWGRTLKGLGGNSNVSLGAGIVGAQFACAAEMLGTYSSWAKADSDQFKEMMMRVFYPANDDFLWRHHDTFWREGGSTHYRLNWDTANLASMMAIGILCDNRAVYQQAVDHFKNGNGNGRIERAAWFIHPDGMGQTEEMGRDQGHNIGGWDFMARICQMAWNQGDDLYGYDNNRVLRALEYNAKYNLGNEVPYTPHRNSELKYSEGGTSPAGRGNFVPMYEMVYNHYVNQKGLAAPYSQQVAEKLRPEGGPNIKAHPSTYDWFGFGSLTYTLAPITSGALPSELRSNWSNGQVALSWWGSAYAKGYNVKRATKVGGPYTTIGTTDAQTTYFSDTGVKSGASYYYVVSSLNANGESANSVALPVAQSLVNRYAFDGDATGATVNGSPSCATGKVGTQALVLDGVDDYVTLPKGVANYQDVTVAAWVKWDGSTNFQRVFDFGSEIEASMWLTPKAGNGKLHFEITTTRGAEGTGALETDPLPIGQWTHVAVTLNSDTGTLYVNGVSAATNTITLDPLFAQTNCYIGESQYPDALFKGSIDDFRIYNYALSADEIAALVQGK